MSKEELEKSPIVRLTVSGGLITAIIGLLALFGTVIMYAASKTDATQVEKIVDYKLAPLMENVKNINETIGRIERKLDRQ